MGEMAGRRAGTGDVHSKQPLALQCCTFNSHLLRIVSQTTSTV